MIIRRLVVPLSFAALALTTAQAQDAFPAPPPGSTSERDRCMNEFLPLRQEAEARGRLIKAASERHAPPDEACALIGNFGQSEIKMIKYVDANSSKCGIALQVADRLKAGHRNTEAMQKKVCAVAQLSPHRGPAGPVGDFDDTR